jgi:nucleoside-diphosphate-sugar epimerase
VSTHPARTASTPESAVRRLTAFRVQKVAITGGAGLLGRVLTRGLRQEYEVTNIDRVRRRGEKMRRADMAARPAAGLFEDTDVVIDLAADPDAVAPWPKVWKNNLRATANALELAVRARVRRLIFASSNHVTGMYEDDPPYSSIVAGDYGDLDPDATPMINARFPVRPDGWYAVGKAFGEAAGRYYSDEFGVSVICLRIGTVNREDRPLEPRHFATLLTHADLIRLVVSAITAPDELRFGVYYGVSRNRWRFWDIEEARAEIGYNPQDDAEAFRVSL